MNELQQYFINNQGKAMQKWMHYFDIYDQFFKRFKDTDVHLLEFGVAQGGSLQMWKQYFGKNAKIYGVDIDERCRQHTEDSVEIFIGNQQDRKFLKNLKSQLPKIDILIDDGGHRMRHQINTFDEMFPHISDNGIYLCEDMHTSYWTSHGGGYRNPSSFIEYTKHLIDHLNAWHSKDSESFRVSDFTRSAYSMHYYDSVLVIEKKKISKPIFRRTGNDSF